MNLTLDGNSFAAIISCSLLKYLSILALARSWSSFGPTVLKRPHTHSTSSGATFWIRWIIWTIQSCRIFSDTRSNFPSSPEERDWGEQPIHQYHTDSVPSYTAHSLTNKLDVAKHLSPHRCKLSLVFLALQLGSNSTLCLNMITLMKCIIGCSARLGSILELVLALAE